jgi:hypothetical protein
LGSKSSVLRPIFLPFWFYLVRFVHKETENEIENVCSLRIPSKIPKKNPSRKRDFQNKTPLTPVRVEE